MSPVQAKRHIRKRGRRPTGPEEERLTALIQRHMIGRERVEDVAADLGLSRSRAHAIMQSAQNTGRIVVLVWARPASSKPRSARWAKFAQEVHSEYAALIDGLLEKFIDEQEAQAERVSSDAAKDFRQGLISVVRESLGKALTKKGAGTA